VNTGLSTADLAAFGWFVVAWLGYRPLMSFAGRRRTTINDTMAGVRRVWMEAMLQRENRMPDAVLIGHVMRTASFFASATVVVIAALLGTFGSIDRVRTVVEELAPTAAGARSAIELKVGLVLLIIVYGFMAFTWAIRQFNYAVALIGAAPPAPVEAALAQALAADLAELLDLAVQAFNSGIRAYYFALAALTWIVSPLLFMLATAAVAVLLFWRQMGSRTAGVLQRVAAPRTEARD
jgi:uncharacterized membrane protein